MEKYSEEPNREDILRLIRDFQDSGVDISEGLADAVKEFKIWQMGSTDSDGNPQTTTLRGLTLRNQVPVNTPEATPAKITPSKKRPIKRDHELLFVFSDTQIDYRKIDGELVPIHDELAIAVGRLLCKDLQPDLIINCGDTVDLAGLSRFPADSDHFFGSLKPGFQAAHNMYARLRADNPSSRIIEVDSNHNTRLMKKVLKDFPEMYNFVREDGEYPVLSYPFLARLDTVEVEWVSGYGAAEFIYDNRVVFIHGTDAVSNGSTAAKLSKKYPEVHVVQGHAHTAQTHWKTNRYGDYLSYHVCGAMCRITGEVPGYHSAVDDFGKPVHRQQDWQQSVMLIRNYGNGYIEFEHVMIRDGIIYYQGKEYNAKDLPQDEISLLTKQQQKQLR